MAKNPHFRVLALTATPGSTPDAVQAIVDSLHISRIEIRDEGSLDLREYMHKKVVYFCSLLIRDSYLETGGQAAYHQDDRGHCPFSTTPEDCHGG